MEEVKRLVSCNSLLAGYRSPRPFDFFDSTPILQNTFRLLHFLLVGSIQTPGVFYDPSSLGYLSLRLNLFTYTTLQILYFFLTHGLDFSPYIQPLNAEKGGETGFTKRGSFARFFDVIYPRKQSFTRPSVALFLLHMGAAG